MKNHQSDAMTEKETTNGTVSSEAALPEHEQELLDTALLESDQLLARSLHDDEARRKRKRLAWLSALVIGGVAMSVVFIGILAGWFAVTEVEVAQAEDAIAKADDLSAAGWKLWKEGDLIAAEEKFSKAVKLDPNAPNAWNGLGWSRCNSGQSEGAIEAFEKCVALEPKHPAALNGLGQIYLTWKDYDRAEKYLLLAAPHAPAAYFGLARVYLLQGEFEKALPWAKKIAAANADVPGAEKMLAAAQAGKLDDKLRKTIEPAGKPKNHSANAARGWQMFNGGRMHMAEKLFRQSLEQDKENLMAINGLAFCLLNQGKHEQAKPLFEKYLSKEKDAGGPMNGLARCLKAEGKVDEAIALWEKMAEKFPGPTAATSGLAQTHLERKEYAKAAEYYKQLVDSAPANKFFQQGLANAEAGIAAKQ